MIPSLRRQKLIGDIFDFFKLCDDFLKIIVMIISINGKFIEDKTTMKKIEEI